MMDILQPEDFFRLDFLFRFVLFDLVCFLVWNFTICKSYTRRADLSGNGRGSDSCLFNSTTSIIPEFALKNPLMLRVHNLKQTDLLQSFKFQDGETEAKNSEVTCLRQHTKGESSLGMPTFLYWIMLALLQNIFKAQDSKYGCEKHDLPFLFANHIVLVVAYV